MLSCDAGTACSLVLLQVSTATAGTKSQGQPTRATPTSSNSTETMATGGQPMRAGRSQAAAAEVGMVGDGEGVVSSKELGRDRKRQENDGNFVMNCASRASGPSPIAGGGDTSTTCTVAEQTVTDRSSTPALGQAQAQRGKGQQDKPFSYAQALKTKSSPFSKPPLEGGVARSSRSKLSSRSETPSESSLLGAGGGMIMKGAPQHNHSSGGNPACVEDSETELRSGSALSITTATDSVVSDRSASRQGLAVIDTSSRREEEECTFDTRKETIESEYNEAGDSITFMGPRLKHESVVSVTQTPPRIAPMVVSSDLSSTTNQYVAPSPSTAASVSPVSTAHSADTDYPNQHSAQMLAPPTLEQSVEATTFIGCERSSHSPTMLSPGPPPILTLNKEHQYTSPGASPQQPSDPSTGAQAQGLKVIHQFEEEAPPSGLGDEEADGCGKDRPPAVFLPPSQKPPTIEAKDDVHDMMLPLQEGRSSRQENSGGGGGGVLPNPVLPHLTSILPHPPTSSQLGFPAPPQQPHLPLRPPGKSEKENLNR